MRCSKSIHMGVLVNFCPYINSKGKKGHHWFHSFSLVEKMWSSLGTCSACDIEKRLKGAINKKKKTTFTACKVNCYCNENIEEPLVSPTRISNTFNCYFIYLFIFKMCTNPKNSKKYKKNAILYKNRSLFWKHLQIDNILTALCLLYLCTYELYVSF